MNKGWAKLEELTEYWTFEDLMEAHDCINVLEDAEREANNRG